MLAVGGRLALLAAVGSHRFVRDYENGQIARSILNGRGYSAGIGWLSEPGQPTAHKPPLYPLFLAEVFALFPDEWNPIFPDRGFPKAHLLATLVQIAVFGAVVGLVGIFGNRFFGRPAGTLGAGWLALNPAFAYQPLLIERMTFDMLFVTLCAWLFVDLAIRPRLHRAALSGFVCGLSLLNNAALAPAVCLLLIWLWRRTGSFRTAAVAAGVMAVTMAPWAIRNSLVFGSFTPLTSQFGVELWIGNHAGASGGLFDTEGRAVTVVPKEILAQTAGMNEVERYDHIGKLALANIRRNPGRALAIRLASFLRFWAGDLDRRAHGGLLFRGVLWARVMTVAIAWLGVICCVWMRKGPNAPLVILMLGLALPYTLTHGGDRYSDGLAPILCLYCANACVLIAERVREWSGAAGQLHRQQVQ